MKKNIVGLASILILSLCTNAKSTESKNSIAGHVKEKFENRLNSVYERYHLQGDFLIGLVGPTGLLYSHSFNKKMLEGNDFTLDNNSPFFIASHTKALTGTLLKILEEEGKVDLNKSIHDYLPELIYDDNIDTRSIKVRQLLNHTAGFTSIMHTFKTAFLGFRHGEKELQDALNYKTLSAKQGHFRYSNTGPILAGMIVEKVTGNSWQEEMQKRIFAPLEMHNTSSKVSSYLNDETLPSIETSADNQIFQTGFYKQDITMHAAGGTISTINDLSNWMRFNINQEQTLLKNNRSFDDLHRSTTPQRKTFFTYKRNGYSLGWDIATYRGETILTRFGGNGGISFHASFIPSRKIGVIAFYNEDRAYLLPHLMANYLYNLMLDSAKADISFVEESETFHNSYVKSTKQALSKSMVLNRSTQKDKFIGSYKNNEGWPELLITKSSNHYLVKWGILAGPLVKFANDQKNTFLAALGPLRRKIQINEENGNIILKNGSIKYIKVD